MHKLDVVLLSVSATLYDHYYDMWRETIREVNKELLALKDYYAPLHGERFFKRFGGPRYPKAVEISEEMSLAFSKIQVGER